MQSAFMHHRQRGRGVMDERWRGLLVHLWQGDPGLDPKQPIGGRTEALIGSL
jgi:hypothetical protein